MQMIKFDLHMKSSLVVLKISCFTVDKRAAEHYQFMKQSAYIFGRMISSEDGYVDFLGINSRKNSGAVMIV